MRTPLSRDMIMIEVAPPGGGVPIVTLPLAPVAPPQMAPAPTPPLPSPPSPILPTPGIDIADEFQFDGMVLGNPSTPADAFELLGFIPFQPPSNPFGNFSVTCANITQRFDGAMICDHRPQLEVGLDPFS